MKCTLKTLSSDGSYPPCEQASSPSYKLLDLMQLLCVGYRLSLAVQALIAFCSQLLNFFKSSFYFFSACTLLAAVALVPINYRENGTTEGLPPPEADPDDEKLLYKLLNKGGRDKPEFHGSSLYLTSRELPGSAAAYRQLNANADLVFTYIFSMLALYKLYRSYRSFIQTVRQGPPTYV